MLTDDRLDALMQQEIDGANTPEETAELGRALRDDAKARERHETLRTTAAALDAGREAVESPAGLHEAVLQALRIEAPRMAPARVPAPVAGRARHERRWLRPGVWSGPFWKRSDGSRDRVSGRGGGRGVGGFSNEREGRNMAGKSKAFIAGGFVVGLGLIAYLAFVRPPSNGDVSGTIGAAKKYRSETMTPADVVLGDQETQQILQSAEFHRIMADPDARKVLGSHAFAEAMAAPEVQKILTEQGFQQAISSPIVAALLQNSDFRKVAGDEAMANLLASPKIAQLYAGPELASSPRPNQPEMKPMDLQNKATSEYTTKPFYMKPMDLVKAAPEAELFLKNENFSRLVASPDFAAAMKAGFGEKIFSPEFRVAVDQPALHAIVTSEFASAFANKQVADFLATPGIVSFVQSPQFAAALNAAPSADLSGKVAGD